MKRRAFLKSAAGLFVPAMPALILPRSARAQLNGGMMFPGPGTPASSGSSYTGPMDVAGYGTTYGCWSLRAGSAAIAAAATQNLIEVSDSATFGSGNLLNVKTLTTGNLDVASINAWVTAHSVTTIYVQKVYDQSGNSRDMNGDFNTPPTLVLSALGSFPAMFFNRNAQLRTGNATVTAQPITVSAITQMIYPSAGSRLFSAGSGNMQMGQDPGSGGSGHVFMYASVNLPDVASAADSTWQSLQIVYNGASSTLNSANSAFNPTGTPTTAPSTPGTQGFVGTANSGLVIGSSSYTNSNLFSGYAFEMLVTATAVSSANQASQVANQRAYGAF